MRKKVYVSADWKEPFDSHSWDKEVVDRIRRWKEDKRYGVELICTDDVHDSVTANFDCRRCDIKEECSKYIRLSDVVVFVVGDNTASKKAGVCDGISCSPAYSGMSKKGCKRWAFTESWNKMSYLEYEITTAVLAQKSIILVFNSVYKMESWIPLWYCKLQKDYNVKELCRVAFWKDREHSQDCYLDIKQYLL